MGNNNNTKLENGKNHKKENNIFSKRKNFQCEN